MYEAEVFLLGQFYQPLILRLTLFVSGCAKSMGGRELRVFLWYLGQCDTVHAICLRPMVPSAHCGKQWGLNKPAVGGCWSGIAEKGRVHGIFFQTMQMQTPHKRRKTALFSLKESLLRNNITEGENHQQNAEPNWIPSCNNKAMSLSVVDSSSISDSCYHWNSLNR